MKSETVHILFIDLVSYSLLKEEKQSEAQRTLRALIDTAPAIVRAGDKVRELPRGDGMALVFESRVADALDTALFLDEALRLGREFHVRMGIHTGPVALSDPSDPDSELVGAGIDLAKRVQECADPDHILLSEAAAEPLRFDPIWGPRLHPVGVCEVKHGVRIRLVNFHGTRANGVPYGNEAIPHLVFKTCELVFARQKSDQERVQEDRRDRRHRLAIRLAVYTPLALVLGFVGVVILPVLTKYVGPERLYIEAVHERLDTLRGVPSIRPSARPEATLMTTLANAPSRPSDEPQDTSYKPKGDVAPGRPVPRPRPSDVTRSKREPVPELVGLTVDEAKRDVAPFTLRVIEEYAEHPRGEIFDQSPHQGYLRPGAIVTVHVSRGPKPPEDEPTPEPVE